jgi:tetratricopeptide (TPR) repeat protein
MPTHIDVRLGKWEKAILSNAKAIEADRQLREGRGKIEFYQVYMAHNRHMLSFAAMMSGQSKLALQTIRDMVEAIPAEWRKNNPSIADGFIAMPYEVLLRFGKWDEVLAEPEPEEVHPIARAIRLYARGVAFAAKGEPARARAEQQAFLAAKAKVAPDANFGNNTAADLLGVAEAFLAGEIHLHEGKLDEAITELREAVKREDRLRYDEPPDWIQPVRHALGAALIKAGRAKEAETVYHADLARFPANVWSLHGLARSLRMQKRGNVAKIVETRLKKALKNADIKLSSSCLCLPDA